MCLSFKDLSNHFQDLNCSSLSFPRSPSYTNSYSFKIKILLYLCNCYLFYILHSSKDSSIQSVNHSQDKNIFKSKNLLNSPCFLKFHYYSNFLLFLLILPSTKCNPIFCYSNKFKVKVFLLYTLTDCKTLS